MKKKRIANDLLQSLHEAVAMEEGELKSRENTRKLSKLPYCNGVRVRYFFPGLSVNILTLRKMAHIILTT